MDNKKMFAILAVVVLIVAGAAAAVIALQNNDKKNDEAKDDTPVTPIDTDAEYYKNGITIKNAVASTSPSSSNTFTLTERPVRIVCLFQGNVELMCMFGLEKYIVGAYVRAANMQCNNPEYQAAYDSVNKIEVGSSEWSKEQVMAWDPDLIIGWSSSFTDTMIGTIDFWNSIGVNCFRTNLYGNANGTSVDTYYQLLRDIGAMFNKNEEANKFINQWNGIIKNNEDKLKDAGLTERKRVLIIDYKADTSAGTTYIYGTSMLTGNLINMAGGTCISSGRMDTYTFEEIADMSDFDAVLIVALGYYTTLTQEQHDKVVSFFTDMPVWQHFKTDKPDLIVETLPFYTLYMSGVLKNDCLDQIFKILYPELNN